MDQIIGQCEAINYLTNSFRQGKIAHAYLFCGPQGVGKALVAKFFARLINCENKNSAPCLVCNSCRKIDDGNHPDVFQIRPEEEALGIKISAVRELQERISLKTYEGNYKMFIIEDADLLLEDAANCLLKTLEEPPAQSVLVLIAENRERILPTIISRCQIIKFHPLEASELDNFLIERFSIDRSKAEFLSRISEGSPGRAVSFFTSGYLDKRNLILDELLNSKELEEALWANKKMLLENIEIILSTLRDMLFIKLGLDELLVNTDKKSQIEQFSRKYSYEGLHTIIRRLGLYYDWLQHNANTRLVLSSLELDLLKNVRPNQ